MSSGRGAEGSMRNELIISDSAAVDPNCYYCQDYAHRNEEHKDVPDPKCGDCQFDAHYNNEHDETPDLDCERCQLIAHNNEEHEEAPNPNCQDCQADAHYSSLRSSKETPHSNCWICAKNAHENGEHGMNTTASRKIAGKYDPPIAYTYDADIHCPDCATERFGTEPNSSWVKEDAKDSEGNPVHPVAPWDEFGPQGEYCGTCGEEISAPYGSHEASRKTAAFSNSEYNLPPVAESESSNFFGTPTTKIRYARQRPDEDGFYVRQEVTPFDELGLVTHCEHPDDGTGNHGSYRCGEDPAHNVRTIIVDPNGPRNNYDMSYDQIGTQADSVTCEKHLNHTLKHEHQKATDAYRDDQESE